MGMDSCFSSLSKTTSLCFIFASRKSCAQIVLVLFAGLCVSGVSASGFDLTLTPTTGSFRQHMGSRAPELISEPPQRVFYLGSQGTMLHCITKLTHTRISWRMSDGVTAVEEVEGLRTVLANSDLEIRPFSLEQYRETVHNTTYFCVATNPYGSVISSPITIIPLVGDSVGDWTLEVKSESARLGSSVLFTCVVPEHVRPYVDILEWVHDLDKSGERYVLTSRGQLYIRPITQHDHMQRFKCRAIHRITKEQKDSPSASLFVAPALQAPPTSYSTKLALEYRTVNAQVGDYIKLVCFIQSSLPVSFTWNHDSSTLDTRSDVLILQNAQTFQSGTYTCIVQNDLGMESVQYHVSVEDPLKLVSQSDYILEVTLGQKLDLNCTVSGSNLEEVKWYRDASVVQHVSKTSSALAKMHIPEVRVEDLGIYQCFAYNDRQTVSGRIQVVLSGTTPKITESFSSELISVGSQVTIECSVFGSPLPVISWYKNFKPIYQPLENPGKISTNQDRVTFRTLTMSAYSLKSSVSLSNVELADSAFYTCRATNKAGSDEFTEKVYVKGGPLIEQMDSQVAVAKRQFLLHCFVAGYPIKQIAWFYRSQQVPFNHRQVVHKNGTLEISSVEQSDSGQYECRAEPEITSSQIPMLGAATSTVSVSVSFAPELSPLVLGKRTAGQRFSATCFATVGDSPILISWYRNGVIIEKVNKFDIDLTSTGALSIISISSLASYHSGNYTCKAVNAVGSATSTDTLSVLEPPRFQIEPKNSQVVLGERLEVPCVAVGNPAPSIKWLRQINNNQEDSDGSSSGLEYAEIANDSDVDENTYFQLTGRNSSSLDRDLVVSSRNGSLIIPRSKVKHKGVFMCQASNGIGNDVSKSIQININIPPYFGIGKVEESVLLDTTVVLSCEVFGDKPMSVRWGSRDPSLHALLTDGKIVQSDSSDSQLSEQDLSRFTREMVGKSDPISSTVSRLTIRDTKRVDSAVYFCEASNTFGKSVFNVSLTVLELPDEPENVEVKDVESDSFRLSWRTPFNGNSPLTAYVLSYKTSDEDGYTEVEIPPEKTETLLENLLPAIKYTIFMTSQTAQGRSNPSQVVSVTTKEAEPSGPPRDLDAQVVSSTAVNLTWKSPSKSDRNGLIIGYEMQYVRNSSESKRSRRDAQLNQVMKMGIDHEGSQSTSQHAMVRNLHKFTDYCFRVRARTAVGLGPYTNDVCVQTKEDVPSQAPSNVVAVPGKDPTTISVSFTGIPLDSANGVLIGYKIYYAEVDPLSIASSGRQLVIAKQNQVTIDNLTPFTNYSVSVLGFTSVGDGVESEVVYTVTNQDEPDPPEQIKVFMKTSNSILVVWAPPLRPNGIITQYKVYCDRYRTQNGLRTVLVSPNHNTLTIDGLLLLDDYKVYVTAFTVAGEGFPSQSVKMTVDQRIPARIGAFSRNLTSIWKQSVWLTCPAFGVPVSRVWWTKSGSASDYLELSDRHIVYPGNHSLLISNAAEKDSAVYTCHVENKYGSDSIDIHLTVLAPPDPPLLMLASVSSTEIAVSWSSDSSPESKTQLVRYNIYVQQYNQPSSNPYAVGSRDQNTRDFSYIVRQVTSPAPSKYSIDGLKCGTQYQVYVVAQNQVGAGDASNIVTAKTVGSVPKAPSKSDILLSSNATQIKLDLTSFGDQGCPLTSFRITWSPLDSEDDPDSEQTPPSRAGSERAQVLDVPGHERVAALNRLHPQTWYLVQITATNSAGETKASYKMATTTLNGVRIDGSGFSGTLLMASGAWNFLVDNVVLVALVLCVITLLLLLISSCCCIFNYNSRKSMRVSKYRGEYSNTLRSDPTTTHYMTADSKYLNGSKLKIAAHESFSSCTEAQLRSEQYMQMHNETLNAHQRQRSLSGGANYMMGISAGYDPRASMYSTDFNMAFGAAGFDPSGGTVALPAVMATPSSTLAKRTSQHQHMSYSNLHPEAGGSEMNPLLVGAFNAVDQSSFPDGYSIGPPMPFPEDMVHSGIAVESEKSVSSGSSEHCNAPCRSSSSTFGINQKSEAESGNNVPVKGVVYTYETPNVGNMQTFPLNDPRRKQQLRMQAEMNFVNADDSGIGEYGVADNSVDPEAMAAEDNEDEDCPASDSSLESRLVAAEKRRQNSTTVVKARIDPADLIRSPAAMQSASNFGHFATIRRAPQLQQHPQHNSGLPGSTSQQFFAPVATMQQANYMEMPVHANPHSMIMAGGRSAENSLKCVSNGIPAPPVPPREPVNGGAAFGSTEFSSCSQPALTMGRLPRSQSASVSGLMPHNRQCSNPNINTVNNSWLYSPQHADQSGFANYNQSNSDMTDSHNQNGNTFSQFKSTPLAKMNAKKNTVRSVKRKSSYSIKNGDQGDSNS